MEREDDQLKRFHHKYTLPLILTLLILAIGAIIIGLFNYQQQTTLPNNTNTSAIGVELNQTYGYVDLHKLQANGISFVYLKSTQGRSYFDDDFMSYRDQVQGTNLSYGTIVYYSNESTPRQHLNFFVKKIGWRTGSLPIMIIPAVSSRSAKYLHSLASFNYLLNSHGKKTIIALNYRYHKYFDSHTQFLASGQSRPNQMQYSFWRYTTNGRVKNVARLEKNVTMFSYNGTALQYKQKYGQLTQ